MIISILGTAGAKLDKKECLPVEDTSSKALYKARTLGKSDQNYFNSTHFLLENYEDTFFFLGTSCAIKFQKKLLGDILEKENVNFIEIKDNDLDDIFENVFDLINMAKDDENIILDITHGFRHQPVSALFSATLHRFLNHSNIKIIFAKQEVEYKEYEYIYLDNYLDIAHLSLLLTGFIRTLNFVDSVKIDGFETLPFRNFSKALLSNDFYTLQKSYKNLLETVKRAKKNKDFDHLKELFTKIEETLSVFNGFDKLKIYNKYLVVSKLMLDKNYYLLSLTYLFEAFRFYCSYSFYENKIISENEWKKSDTYKINQDVITFITQKNIKNYIPNYYDEKFPELFSKNQMIFDKIAKNYIQLRKMRNNLTHINPKVQSSNIKKDLEKLFEEIKNIIDNDLLKALQR